MLLGLGWPQWLTIFAMIGALFLTLKVMARASIAYERKRLERERLGNVGPEGHEQGKEEVS
jgi:hypothetical protein